MSFRRISNIYKGPVIIYVEAEAGKKWVGGGGVKAISDWLEGVGGGLNLFFKEFPGFQGPSSSSPSKNS